MADILITKAAPYVGRFVLITREVDGGTVLERAPKETLAIRAAEYNLHPEDDFVLDMILLEPFMPAVEGPGDVHPLYSADTVADALEIMRERVESAREAHGAPRGKNRMMAAAIRNGVASQGLVSAHRLYLDSADPRIGPAVHRMRDAERERLCGVRHIEPQDMVSRMVGSPLNY